MNGCVGRIDGCMCRHIDEQVVAVLTGWMRRWRGGCVGVQIDEVNTEGRMCRCSKWGKVICSGCECVCVHVCGACVCVHM